jgi:HPt (histidine-containing phosphotransfer) domain-containing protein
MPSPPLVPEDRPIDLEHLKRMTLGDVVLEREVLAMFLDQSARLSAALASLPVGAGAMAHTLKGSARAIGAMQVAECASALEVAIGKGEDAAARLRELADAVADARAAIEAMLSAT